MLRVGYPATISADLLHDFPTEIELIPLPDDLDHDVTSIVNNVAGLSGWRRPGY